ncbi:hypothetical protein CAC42_4903 [Sphaceloma murrayae]|uniref:Uncharacterized protein n=1 Tax=Sphaceloma murrayae TaxID=2082308 RepID=A0A2K1QPR6_9PEZI|nr:hypothetical protein CAC42_4903 [Sphaceloma murrayae]
MSHSFSKSWKAPSVVAREHWIRILKSRDHLCPDSPFLPRIFDQTEHNRLMNSARLDLARSKATSTSKDAQVMASNAASRGLDASSLLPLHAHTPLDPTLSVPLCLPTIWAPSAESKRPFTAPWPSIAELKYEGDERIATSLDHRRFLPVPRFPTDVEGMGWAEVAFLPQTELDRVHRVEEEEVLFQGFEVGEREIGEDEGRELLGESLWACLEGSHEFCVEKVGDQGVGKGTVEKKEGLEEGVGAWEQAASGQGD